MKINIWVHKKDVINNKIENYYFFQPQLTGWENFVMITVDHLTFVELENSLSEGNVKIKQELKPHIKKYLTMKGKVFKGWWDNLNKKQQIEISEYYEF